MGFRNSAGAAPALASLLILFTFASAGFCDEPVPGSAKLRVHFFGSETCGECIQIKSELLKPLEDAYPKKLEVISHDIESEEGFELLIELENRFHVTNSSAQTLFLPDTFLTGADDILALGGGLIKKYLENPGKWTSTDKNAMSGDSESSSAKNTIINKFKEFSFLGIFAAGLADGINPCAIATMIFLVSFLATQKRKRNEVLIIGLSFTASVFFTYLLMGVGAFKALSFLSSHLWISKTVKWISVAFAAGIAMMCYFDAARYKRTGKARDIKLQLPKAVKMQIHKVITTQLSGKRLVIGAIVTGFLVTLLEAVCTGQVYLPTIILMTRQEGLKFTGWLYLIFYNILFVTPLLIVMVLAYYGMTWEKLSKKMQSNLVALKIILGTVLLSLALFLAASL